MTRQRFSAGRPERGERAMMAGTVESIYLHAGREGGEPMLAVAAARAQAGAGFEGDRFFQGPGSPARRRGPDREVTLIEAEAIEAVNREGKVTLQAEASRRNIVTRGVALNHLVHREFRVGPVLLRGLRLCEPCKHLESLTGPGMLMALLHRGGLRAQVLEGGEVRVGDAIRPLDPATVSPPSAS